ncbi:Hpt domain-containing protein [Desulfonatronospira sp. MSAO_Bac3]|uniref:Hpt domain-containing protein n=1 Tax=Desulfonatronospira sp. MSAO_Bac3 TaxID=2293857 RepID=UPI000FF84230|nr:Hpt domain-containing protein [Desulfonatronospira sp. MSAO_Bac3]RQD74017.1 MAG: STAS domain-containing protein [Desulfonatronospira sp. MSAO_Bac3]
MADELVTAFVEDSREHLESIESDILILESMEGGLDEELVNRIFRTAHSVKGAAGFLGLYAIKDLAHKLENALHLLRDGQISTSAQSHFFQVLLQGFDMLKLMINDPDESENLDISEVIRAVNSVFPAESLASEESTLMLSAEDGHNFFTVDDLSLEHALKGGKFLYHFEFDLINDIHRQNKTPYDIIRTLQDSGLILECRVDIDAVGDLDMEITNRIPMNVLYATIIDPEIISVLLNISPEKIRRLSREMFHQQGRSTSGLRDGLDSPVHDPGLAGIREDQGALVVQVPEQADRSQAFRIHQALLRALDSSPNIRLDMTRTEWVDASFAQLVIAAHKSCLLQGGSLGIVAPIQEPVARSLQELGLSPFTGGAQ